MELQKANEQKMWPRMWGKMSPASKSYYRGAHDGYLEQAHIQVIKRRELYSPLLCDML
jgi:hypothetical protein